MKTLLNLIFILQIGILSSQNIKSELIIGTWKFEKEHDFRTEKESSESEKVIIDPIEIENGTRYPDRTFHQNGKFEFYYNKTQSTKGKYEFKSGNLICWKMISINQIKEKPKFVESLLKRKQILKKKDGNYYFSKPTKLQIKSITKSSIEFGTEKKYSVWKRIK